MALRAARGNRSDAARRLAITRVTLRAKIRRYGLA
jgi:DNA-binding protein Fis